MPAKGMHPSLLAGVSKSLVPPILLKAAPAFFFAQLSPL